MVSVLTPVLGPLGHAFMTIPSIGFMGFSGTAVFHNSIRSTWQILYGVMVLMLPNDTTFYIYHTTNCTKPVL